MLNGLLVETFAVPGNSETAIFSSRLDMSPTALVGSNVV